MERSRHISVQEALAAGVGEGDKDASRLRILLCATRRGEKRNLQKKRTQPTRRAMPVSVMTTKASRGDERYGNASARLLQCLHERPARRRLHKHGSPHVRTAAHQRYLDFGQKLHDTVPMSTLCRLAHLSIRINVPDHRPPHVHVVLPDRRDAPVFLDTLQVVSRSVRPVEIADALGWIKTHRDEARRRFEEWNP